MLRRSYSYRTDGISTEIFRERFGKDIYEVYGSIIKKHEADGLLSLSDGRLRFSPRGLDVSNTVLKDFV